MRLGNRTYQPGKTGFYPFHYLIFIRELNMGQSESQCILRIILTNADTKFPHCHSISSSFSAVAICSKILSRRERLRILEIRWITVSGTAPMRMSSSFNRTFPIGLYLAAFLTLFNTLLYKSLCACHVDFLYLLIMRL